MVSYIGTHDFSSATVLGVTANPQTNLLGVTVGASGTADCPNPDYPTVAAAFAAGHRNIDVVSDTIEDGSVTDSVSGIYIRLHGAKVIMGINPWTVTQEMVVSGRGRIVGNGGRIFFSSSGGNLLVDGVTLEGKNNTINPIDTGPSTTVNLSNMELQCALGTRDYRVENAFLSNIVFRGFTGVSNGLTLEGDGICYAENIKFVGTWPSNSFPLNMNADGATVDGVSFEANAANVRFALNRKNMKLSNVYRGDGLIELTISLRPLIGLQMSDCVAQFNDFNLPGNLHMSDSMFVNCVASGLGGLTSSNRLSDRNTYTNCKLGDRTQAPSTAEVVLWGNDNVWNGVTFYQDVSIAGSGHIFNDCRFGGDVTVEANASGVLLGDCIVNGSFTDNGVDTVGTII